MSYGSRATQVKPEALVILFRATPESASLLRVTAGLCSRAEDLEFPQGNLSSRVLQAGSERRVRNGQAAEHSWSLVRIQPISTTCHRAPVSMAWRAAFGRGAFPRDSLPWWIGPLRDPQIQ